MKTLAATELLIALLSQSFRISQSLQAAQAGQRDLTDSEWNDIIGDNDAARSRLEAAIRKARESGN